MAGEFGKFIDKKHLDRKPDGGGILLKDFAKAMGATPTYFSDIVKGWRNPPEMFMLLKISGALHLSPEEQAEMFDLAGRNRSKAAPDLPEYITDENLPHVRAALRKANDKDLEDVFWKQVYDAIDKKK